jgi:hypothetical protein
MTTMELTVDRNALYDNIRGLSDFEVAQVLWFIKLLKRDATDAMDANVVPDDFYDDIDSHRPNAETLKAMREFEHPEDLPTYDSLEEMFKACGVTLKTEC